MKSKFYLFIQSLFFFFLTIPMALSQISIGNEIDNFSLKGVDGNVYSLHQYTNKKGVIIIFDSNVCPFSKKYNSRIKALHDNYSAKNFQLLVINSNDMKRSPGDSYEKMIEYAKSHNYKFPYLHDEEQKIARYFGATNTPHVYLLEVKNNKFILVYKGTIDDNYEDEDAVKEKYVENALNSILQNTPIQVKTTKAIGCTIKWKKK